MTGSWTETWALGVWFVLPFGVAGTLVQSALGLAIPQALLVGFFIGTLSLGIRSAYEHPGLVSALRKPRVQDDFRGVETAAALEGLQDLLLRRMESVETNLAKQVSGLGSRVDSVLNLSTKNEAIQDQIRQQREAIEALHSKTDELIAIQKSFENELNRILALVTQVNSTEIVHRSQPTRPLALDLKRQNLVHLHGLDTNAYQRFVEWVHQGDAPSNLPDVIFDVQESNIVFEWNPRSSLTPFYGTQEGSEIVQWLTWSLLQQLFRSERSK